jgi:hypothetical protein
MKTYIMIYVNSGQETKNRQVRAKDMLSAFRTGAEFCKQYGFTFVGVE